MIIDSHVHLSYLKEKKDFAEIKNDLLLNMKKLGIDYSLVIPDNVSGSDCADLETVSNLTKNEKKLFMVGTLNVFNIKKKTLSKIDNLFKSKVIRGFKIFPGHDPIYPTDKRWKPVFKLCIKHNLPLIIHTGINPYNKKVAKYNDPKHIIKVAKNYPKLKIIISHYFWPKLDYCFSITNGFKNVYFDISGLADPEVIKASGDIKKIKEILIKTIKRDKRSLLFGTDWPMCKVERHLGLIDSLRLTKEDKKKILSKNALKVFKMK